MVVDDSRPEREFEARLPPLLGALEDGGQKIEHFVVTVSIFLCRAARLESSVKSGELIPVPSVADKLVMGWFFSEPALKMAP
jgi:hypothetical protein